MVICPPLLSTALTERSVALPSPQSRLAASKFIPNRVKNLRYKSSHNVLDQTTLVEVKKLHARFRNRPTWIIEVTLNTETIIPARFNPLIQLQVSENQQSSNVTKSNIYNTRRLVRKQTRKNVKSE